jgi:hypothetical protein
MIIGIVIYLIMMIIDFEKCDIVLCVGTLSSLKKAEEANANAATST